MSLQILLDPLAFGFMQKAFLMAVVVALPTALLSCFLVIKGWALLGDAVSHAILPGVVLAYILGIPLIIGAFVAGMLCAVVTGYISNNSRIKADTVMGVVFSGMFGVGLIMFVAVDTGAHLDHILFGDLLGVDVGELWLTSGIALAITGAVFLLWRDLLLHSFDAAQARAIGLPTRVYHYGLLAGLSLAIVATLATSGLILAIGLLIAPGAIAFLLVRNFAVMLWLSVVIALVAMLGGLYASFYMDSAPAPTIILILSGMFIVAFLWSGVVRYLRTRSHA
ncbi:MAG: metal ABC transporter permease [Proteobacteria bacterium]|nr:metal ABC transporter permease [Pseudomonadota bacterium]